MERKYYDGFSDDVIDDAVKESAAQQQLHIQKFIIFLVIMYSKVLIVYTTILLILSISAHGKNITMDSCNSITSMGLKFIDARYFEGTCVVECEQPNIECLTFSDGVVNEFEKNGLYDKNICVDTTVQAKGADPNTDDPEMIVNSCPEFFLFLGWDRNEKRTLGNMRQEVVCKTEKALQVMIDLLKQV